MSVAAVFVKADDAEAEAAIGYAAARGYRVWPVVGSDVIPSFAEAVYAPGNPDVERRASAAGLVVIAPPTPIGD